MNVNLTPDLERFVQAKVASGLYNSQSEVVREALRLLAERDQAREAHLEGLRGALHESLAQAEEGNWLEGPEVVREMRDRLQLSPRGSRKG